MTRMHEPDIKAFLLSLGMEIPRDDFVRRRRNDRIVADVYQWLLRRIEFFVPLDYTKHDVCDLAQETMLKLISRASRKYFVELDIEGSGAEYIMATFKSVISDYSRKRHTIKPPRIKSPARDIHDEHQPAKYFPPLWRIPVYDEHGEPNGELTDEDRNIRSTEAMQIIDQMDRDLPANLVQTVQIIALAYINQDTGLSVARKAGCSDEQFEKDKSVLRRALRKIFSLS